MPKMNKGNGVCNTEQQVSPPGSPNVKNAATDWPSEGYDYGLKQSKQSGKNRERKSFSGGHQW